MKKKKHWTFSCFWDSKIWYLKSILKIWYFILIKIIVDTTTTTLNNNNNNILKNYLASWDKNRSLKLC